MKCKYAVTFEFDMNPPVTARGMVEGSSSTTVMKRALQKAIADHPHMAWQSLVVLLEKADN